MLDNAVYPSPSSRRAWIEMDPLADAHEVWYVALLAEGVDRNPSADAARERSSPSPSSRRAWIEIGPRNRPKST